MAAGGPEWPDRNAGRAEWSSPPLFKEVQKFRDLWWWKALMVVTGLALTVPVALAFLQKIPGGITGFHGTMGPPAMLSAAIGLAAGILSLMLLYAMRLETSVTPAGVHVRFRPFHFKAKFYPFGEITSAEAVTYRPLLDYGGWGIRYGRNGWAYNVRGNRGVLLKFRDRGNLLIGSMNADEMAGVISKYAGHNRNT